MKDKNIDVCKKELFYLGAIIIAAGALIYAIEYPKVVVVVGAILLFGACSIAPIFVPTSSKKENLPRDD